MAERSSREDETHIDLAEVHRLVAALERDLEKLDSGSGDVGPLREEVRALAAVLESPAPDHGHVAERLRATHGRLTGLLESGAEYAARIGRMLGM